MKPTISQILQGVMGVVILILLITTWNEFSKNRRLQSDNNFYKTQQDTLRVIVNTKTKEVEYHKQLFQGSQKDIKLLQEHNRELYEIAKNPKIQTVIKSEIETKIETVTKDVVVYVDSSKGGEVRKSRITNEFYNADITSYPDSTKLNLRAWSPLTITVEKDGKLKATTPIGSPISITELQGFNKVEPKKKNRWWIPLGIGIVGGAIGTHYLTK